MDPGEETQVPLSDLQTRKIMLASTFRYANTYPAAIELIELATIGAIDVDALMTSHYGLKEAEAALRAPGEEPEN